MQQKPGYVHSAESQKKVADGLEKLRAEYKNAQAEMDKMKKSGTATDAELDNSRKPLRTCRGNKKRREKL